MFEKKKFFRVLFSSLVVLSLATPLNNLEAQSKKKKGLPQGRMVLWQRPADISKRDLLLGPGGRAMRPDLRRIDFIKEEKGGYSKKYRVRDASGREWVAKIGKEAQSETSAVRLMWAVGYETEINYLVPRVQINGKGTFTNVRFEARPDNVERLDEWKWKRNPFVGSPQFQGLKLMMALMNNWDIKDSNNKILLTRGASGNELRYIISDLGATFGHAGGLPFFWRINRSRSNPEKYARTDFIDGVKGNRVRVHYHGKNRGLFHNISIEDAGWITDLLTQLTDQQIRDAFAAANYTPQQINLLTHTVKQRIYALRNTQMGERLGRNSR